MDIILVENLTIPAKIGVHRYERSIEQKLTLSLELATQISAASLHDHVQYALDYEQVCSFVIDFMQENEVHLLETLADRLAQALLSAFAIPWLRLTISKSPRQISARSVSIVIERGTKLST